MKFILDTDVSPKLCAYLQDADHDAVHIDTVLAEGDYPSLIAAAGEQGRVVISRDPLLDFKRRNSPYPDLPLFILEDVSDDPDVLGPYLCAALTPSAQSFIAQGTVTYLQRSSITFTDVVLTPTSDRL
ncbi:DUF5615 family PIN-like protein [Haloechinothrix salitolerans]|uniref:DUF5615 family PIN-like protein n=1 Tax=Haloechinothrix salitolerans TaxID=926830 RepID=A0ABW2BXT5_9PSEU